MKKSTLDIWKKLQKEGYFQNHPLYKNMELDIPHCINYKDIYNKNIVEIGCGYGRETFFFADYANQVYAIDVSQDILLEIENEDKENIQPVLAENYKKDIPNNIDYVYALHVFQHLAPEQATDYIDTFYEKMNKGAKINIQFFIGTEKVIEENKEPRVQYTKLEALSLFKKFRIEKTWTLHKFDAKDSLQYEHFYIIGRKQ